MQIVIKVLDVGDGDSIIVHLKKGAIEIVFFIDGGRSRDYDFVLREMEITLKEAKKKAPDFILCTHYDDDHIGGLAKILTSYQEFKPPVWMHKTSEVIDFTDFMKELELYRQDDAILPSEANDYVGGALGTDLSYYEQAIKNIQQERSLIQLMKDLDIACQEPLTETFYIENWPELSIVSPSLALYQELFPKHFKAEDYLRMEVEQIKADENGQSERLAEQADPYEALDRIMKNSITATNMNSAMLLLTVKDKKFLFAADAGITAFDRVPNEVLSGLYWLKVPHHGSKNNLTSAHIKMMQPKIAVISGNKHISSDVVSCFQAIGSTVYTTRESGTIITHEIVEEVRS